MKPDPEPETVELKIQQDERERTERRMERDAPAADEAAQHARRADKAAYLRSKLEQRERAERNRG